MADPAARRRGGVLAVVLLLVLALELLAHGALLMARQEAAASHAGARLLQARTAAMAGLADHPLPAGTTLGPVPLQATLPGATGSAGEGRYELRLRRLGREEWLVWSEGRVEGSGGVVRLGALAWIPDPAARLRAFGGVAVVGATAPVSVAGAIETVGVRRDGGDLDVAPCRPWLPVLDSLFGRAPVEPLVREELDGPAEPSLGRLGSEQLIAWIGGGGGGATGPSTVAGDLRLEEVAGEGLLVVSGDLEMVGGRHEGVLLVGGTLTLRDGAILVGFVRAAEGLVVGPDARVIGSGCRALVALAEGLEGWVRPLLLPPGPFPLY